jgi:hypothetical protein
MATNAPITPPRRHRYAWLVWATAALGVALLLIDHWVHVLGVLPYLVILACPLMHFFMHRGHHHGGHPSRNE